VLLFDPDTAGEMAVDRAVSLFLTQPVEIAIATLDEDLDPDEYLLKHGLEAWEKLIAAAPEALAFKWKQLVRNFAAEDGNLTGQQNAIGAYIDLIGQARASGPVDPIRWGLVLSQVSKLTGIPAEQLQKRLSAARPVAKKPMQPVAPASAPASPAPHVEPRRKPGVLSARDRAECWILGVLLLEPGRWQRVQLLISPEDFTDDRRRRLAEVYWNYQRDEGEPEFRDLLTFLGDPAVSGDEASGNDLRSLAIEVTAEVEGFAERQLDFESTLASAMEHLNKTRQHQEKQKLIQTLRGEEALNAEQQVDLLRQLQDRARKPK
jgi:DNA primase